MVRPPVMSDLPLDEEQLSVVTSPEPAIAVMAGPGSGKTRVLSYRTRHLLSQSPDTRALLLTFTKGPVENYAVVVRDGEIV